MLKAYKSSIESDASKKTGGALMAVDYLLVTAESVTAKIRDLTHSPFLSSIVEYCRLVPKI